MKKTSNKESFNFLYGFNSFITIYKNWIKYYKYLKINHVDGPIERHISTPINLLECVNKIGGKTKSETQFENK